MASLKRIGAAFVFAAVMGGGVLVSSPVQAADRPAAFCSRLAAAVETLTNLAQQYPDNALIAALLDAVTEAFQNHCL
jgi:hypothetical protein